MRRAANAGADQSGGAKVTRWFSLDASGSTDPENQGLSYTWTQVGAARR